MANRTDLLQGTLELLILNTLAREPMHGYGIVQRIHEAAEDLLKVEDGYFILRCTAWRNGA
jgi:DNA-binding PadR family transcriptional regulator